MTWILALVAASAAPCPEVVDGRLRDAEAGLSFVSGKADLTDSAAEAVAAIACRLEAEPALQLQIGVHTDPQGSDAFNLRLSQARAEAVGAALQAHGISPDRVHPVGFGETRPLAPSGAAAGPRTHRRVELWVDPTRWLPAPPPTAPAPAPAPRPPAPTPDPCAGLERSVGACGAERDCLVAMTPEALVALADQCLAVARPAVRDGELWVVTLDGATMLVRPAPEGSRIRIAR